MAAAVFAVAAAVGGELIAGTALAEIAWSTVLAKAAFSAGLSMVAESMRETPTPQSPFSSEITARKQLIRASAEPRRVIYGATRVSGALLYVANGTDAGYVHFVIAIAGHSCQAINDVWLGDEAIGALDVDGNVTTGRFAGHVRVKKYLGSTTQVTDPDLAAECPEWGAKARPLKGITYVYLRLKRSRDVFPQGIPTPRFEVQGKNDILDVRTGTTGYTDNAALCTLDYLRWKGGFACDADEIVTDTWATAANVCDEDVALTGGGTQKRYRINGSFTMDRGRAEILDKMRQAMAGAVFYTMGQWFGAAGAAESAVMDIDESDLRGPVRIRPRVPDDKVYNAVRGVYTETAMYTETDFPAVTNAAYETQDGGQRLYKDIQLAFETDPTRSQRLAKIDLERHRQQIVVELQMRIRGLTLRPWNVVRLTLAKAGFVNKLFRVVDWKFNLFGGADLVLEEYSPAIYAWGSAEAKAVDPAPDSTLPNPFDIDPPASLTVASVPLTAADGSLIHRLRVAWATPNNPYIRRGTIQYRRTDATVWQEWPVEDPSQGEAEIAPLEAGDYAARMRWETAIGPRSQWATAGGTAGSLTAAPAAASSLTVTGGLFRNHVVWAYGDARRDAIANLWGATTNNRAVANRLTQARWPATDYEHVGLAAGQTWYYWIDISDTSDNPGSWYPSSPTAGVAASPSADPSALLTQLQGALGMDQLAEALASPLAALTSAANLAHPTSELASAVNAAAESALGLLLQADALRDRVRIEQWVTTNTVELGNGVVRLLATAELTTDVEAHLHQVDLTLGAIDGTIIGHTSTLATHGTRLNAAETSISQLQDQIVLKASSAYVDASLASALGAVSPDAVASNTQLLAEGQLQALLDLDTAHDSARKARASLAVAERKLSTQADAQLAEAVERSILDARVALREAAAITETAARVSGDAVNASSIASLLARLETGDYAAIKVLAQATADALGLVLAKYSVKVDANGRVAGIELMSDGTTSAFIVVSDKFLVYRQDGVGAPVQMFTLGTVNGVTSLVLAGNLIADESIIARHLSVTSLSAITATIGTLRTADSGARMEIHDNVIKSFDAAGNRRAQFGDLSL